MNNKKLKSVILSLMESDIGFDVGYAAMISIRQLEDGTFAVDNDYYPFTYYSMKEKIFKNPKKAVDYFIKMREKRKLGEDFETGENNDK